MRHGTDSAVEGYLLLHHSIGYLSEPIKLKKLRGVGQIDDKPFPFESSKEEEVSLKRYEHILHPSSHHPRLGLTAASAVTVASGAATATHLPAGTSRP